MSFGEFIRYAAVRLFRQPLLQKTIFHPRVRGFLQAWPGCSGFYDRWGYVVHPFDHCYHTDTGGITRWKIHPTSPTDETPRIVYAGSNPSQPSIVRSVLAKLPPLDDFIFIDLGSGKGRILIVATEFTFREIVGVEYSVSVSKVARKNLETVRRNFPERLAVRMETCDVTDFNYPPGNLILFLYNPFREELMRKVVAGIEAAIRAENRIVFVVYNNPVCSDCFDHSPLFTRYLAEIFPYSEEDLGYGPDENDTVVIWQSGSKLPPLPGAGTPIKITKPLYRAELDV